MLQANAVSARTELDLRVGAALTRTQTLGLQRHIPSLSEKLVSYGPCQFPTLGFVVDQYERVRAFVPEDFWALAVVLERDGDTVHFNWHRNRLFDRDFVDALHGLCQDDPTATVQRLKTEPTRKFKPFPLTTVELQKTGSRLLGMSPKKLLDVSGRRPASRALSSTLTCSSTDLVCAVREGPAVLPSHRDGPV